MRGCDRSRPENAPATASRPTAPKMTKTGQIGIAPVAEATTSSSASVSDRAAASAT